MSGAVRSQYSVDLSMEIDGWLSDGEALGARKLRDDMKQNDKMACVLAYILAISPTFIGKVRSKEVFDSLSIPGWHLCSLHQLEDSSFPIEAVVRLVVDCLRSSLPVSNPPAPSGKKWSSATKAR